MRGLFDDEEEVKDWQNVEGFVQVGGEYVLGNNRNKRVEVRVEYGRCAQCLEQTEYPLDSILVCRNVKTFGRKMYYFLHGSKRRIFCDKHKFRQFKLSGEL